MRKRYLIVIFVLLCALLAGCGEEAQTETAPTGVTTEEAQHVHAWAAATCDKAQICTGCGTMQGQPLGHKWAEATCETAKTCSVCGAVEGESLGHNWTEASCQAPKTCLGCGETKGDVLEHTVLSGSFDTVTTDGGLTLVSVIYNGKCAVCGEEGLQKTYKTWDEAMVDILPGSWHLVVTADGTTGTHIPKEERRNYRLEFRADGAGAITWGDGNTCTGTWEYTGFSYDDKGTKCVLCYFTYADQSDKHNSRAVQLAFRDTGTMFISEAYTYVFAREELLQLLDEKYETE